MLKKNFHITWLAFLCASSAGSALCRWCQLSAPGVNLENPNCINKKVTYSNSHIYAHKMQVPATGSRAATFEDLPDIKAFQ